MYSIIKTPDLCDPFTKPRNTTEQFKIFSERLTIVFVGSHNILARMWKPGPLLDCTSPAAHNLVASLYTMVAEREAREKVNEENMRLPPLASGYRMRCAYVDVYHY